MNKDIVELVSSRCLDRIIKEGLGFGGTNNEIINHLEEELIDYYEELKETYDEFNKNVHYHDRKMMPWDDEHNAIANLLLICTRITCYEELIDKLHDPESDIL